MAQNIWGDLEKRSFTPAMDILRVLAASEKPNEPLSEPVLWARLKGFYTENQFSEALRWLDDSGLVHRQEVDVDYYRIWMALLSRWLQMEMSVEEMEQWQAK